jgi:hypothetical protein
MGTPELPCCAARTVVEAAEAVLLDAEQQQRLEFLRTPLEIRTIEILRDFYPSAVTGQQLTECLELPRETARTLAYALFQLGVSEHSRLGHYRYKPVSEEARA